MQVFGNIATELELVPPKHEGGKPFYACRLAENQGKGDHRKTTWYNVVAFIDEMDADLLSKGQFVKITGRLEVEAFMKKDGTPGASLKIITSSIQPVESQSTAPQS